MPLISAISTESAPQEFFREMDWPITPHGMPSEKGDPAAAVPGVSTLAVGLLIVAGTLFGRVPRRRTRMIEEFTDRYADGRVDDSAKVLERIGRNEVVVVRDPRRGHHVCARGRQVRITG